ncbi:MAG TPA: S53 family peptidase [Candidatus Paceibacterota bacterium]|nr:S53 family peptidase [Candidatus Paceibacterota bacterium]
MTNKKLSAVLVALLAAASALVPAGAANAAYRFSDFQGKPPVHVYRSAEKAPSGVTPAEIKKIYNLPASGGKGTIALIDAYDDANMEGDLAVFDKQFNLPACTTTNGCFEKHEVATGTASNSGWAMETSLDVEWAHAIAPNAKILLVEAKTPSGANLLSAIDYAASRKDVVAISMSWGGAEFSDELSYDTHFVDRANPAAAFFASSGDDGTGASWPASSPNVIGVGGTSLALASSGALVAESAWSGSGGGVSAYEKEPAYQATYKISKANGMRAIPDVSYNADPVSGYPVYLTTGTSSKAKGSWNTVGGTSAGAPQWAAIQALGGSAALAKFYVDKASTSTLKYFRDITSGSNGDCTYYCDARKRYDYVTGLGSPQTTKF